MITARKIRRLLENSRTIAVIGASDDIKKPSYKVAKYLEGYYEVIPVNPREDMILGKKAYKNILDVKEIIDIVDIFRPSSEVYGIVEDAIKIKPRAIWMQEGIKSREAKALALKEGIMVVMDRCIMRDHKSMISAKKNI